MIKLCCTTCMALFIICLSVFSQEVKKETKSDEQKKPSAMVTDAELLESYKKYDLLMFYPSVHKELKVTPSQRTQLLKIYEKQLRHIEDLKKKFEQLPPTEDPLVKKQRLSHFILTRKSFQAEIIEKEMIRVLNIEQRRRLNEILLQAEGPIAFLRPEVQDQLNIVPIQLMRIQENIIKCRNSIEQTRALSYNIRKYVQPDPEDRSKIVVDPQHQEEVYTKVKNQHNQRMQIRNSLVIAVDKLLSKRQREAYLKMKGNPFDIDTLHRVTGTLQSLIKEDADKKTKEDAEKKLETIFTK